MQKQILSKRSPRPPQGVARSQSSVCHGCLGDLPDPRTETSEPIC